jgi:hypothetical protein
MEPLTKSSEANFVLNSATPEDIDKQIEELKSISEAKKKKEKEAEETRLSKERETSLQYLAEYQNELAEMDEVMKIAGKLSVDEARKLSRQRVTLEQNIATLEKKLGINQILSETELPAKKKDIATVWPTVAKIVGLLLACWGIVIYSGDWILEKYPNAAIYNDVSFQKVLFGFSVFIAGIASVILALAVFFPGLSKYFNPFNRDQLDFYSDFKELSEWQRNIISVALFFALLLAFVLTVSGKLD